MASPKYIISKISNEIHLTTSDECRDDHFDRRDFANKVRIAKLIGHRWENLSVICWDFQNICKFVARLAKFQFLQIFPDSCKFGSDRKLTHLLLRKAPKPDFETHSTLTMPRKTAV